MAGAVTIDNSVTSTSGLDEDDRSVSCDSLSEWRSCEQIDNGSPSTSPPFWDIDCEDDDPGPRPSDLFGQYTWRIENFSKEKEREMKSEPFEAGGYKWYILVYPQGCDVSNHLSLFLCVANHEKLFPGWSHFAQFTIAVGNLDPKKIKYSDTLHKFWKKEHDWGWKKFMELSKIQDDFLVDDVLEITAQVQVIREKADRPFRCLDRPYRRELLRVYMTNIEQIYRRVVEDRRSKLIKLIEDKVRWSSFRAFWLAIDPTTRHHMSNEKRDTILKIVVKSFFVEKEVTSTLVMDALYTGLKALEHHSKGNEGALKSMAVEELSTPMVHVDVDMFVLAGDFVAVLERAALEPLSCQSPSLKDDKCSQSRAKDGGSEVNQVSIEREERRLTEIGRKILEIFVLSHIFSGIEVAYREAVALKRQEELIREEELLENEMKGKHGDKRAKKKQSKHKKNNRKIKDKEREEISDSNIPEEGRDGNTNHGREDSKQAGQLATKVDNSEECASDVLDNLNGSAEVCQTDMCDKNTVPVNATNDVGIEPEANKDSTLEIESLISSVTATVNSIRGKINNLLDSTGHVSPNRGRVRRKRVISKMNTVRDEDYLLSISSCTDRNQSRCGPSPNSDQETSLLTLKDRLHRLGQKLHEKEIEGRELLKAHLEKKVVADAVAGSPSASSSDFSEKAPKVLKCPERSSVTISDADINAPPPKAVLAGTSDAGNGTVPALATSTESTKSVPIVTPTPSKLECNEDVSNSRQKNDRAKPSRSPLVDKAVPTPPKSPLPQVDTVAKAAPATPKSSSSQIDKVAKGTPAPPKPSAPQINKADPHNSVSRQNPSVTISKAQEDTIPEGVAITSVPRTPTPTLRPSSAPLFQASRSTVPPTPTVQVSPLLSRSMTVSGQMSSEPSPSAPSDATQAYRNAIHGMGCLDTSSVSLGQSTSKLQSVAVSQPLSAYASATPVMLPPVERNDQLSGKQGFMSGFSKSEALDNWHPWKVNNDVNRQKSNNDVNRQMWRDDTPNQQMIICDSHVHTWKDTSYQQVSNSGSEQSRFEGMQYKQFQREMPANSVSYQQQGPMVEEFPHLDIINDLLDEEQHSGSVSGSPLNEYRTFGLPFASNGTVTDSEMSSVSISGQFNLTDHYEGYRGAYIIQNPLHRLRDGHLSTLDVYSNGRLDSTASKPWLYSRPNPAVNLGINTNFLSPQMGEYSDLASGRVNGEYLEHLYRRPNGQW